jgi:hypothetical protein
LTATAFRFLTPTSPAKLSRTRRTTCIRRDA